MYQEQVTIEAYLEYITYIKSWDYLDEGKSINIKRGEWSVAWSLVID